jgi:hypothetical protein
MYRMVTGKLGPVTAGHVESSLVASSQVRGDMCRSLSFRLVTSGQGKGG